MTEKNVGKDNTLIESINDSITESIQEANESAVVVGASLSGLMAGIALARAGLNVTILERAGAKPRSGAVLRLPCMSVIRQCLHGTIQ